MSAALLKMNYIGSSGVGFGTMYVGHGKIAGTDVGGGFYTGTYKLVNNRMVGTGNLSFPAGGTLVTGQMVPANSNIPVSVDWPADFDNGNPQQIAVLGNNVTVTFQKVADLP